MILAAIALTLSSSADVSRIDGWLRTPTVNISAIREIDCDDVSEKTNGWTGSGALIDNRTMVTAYHVVNGGKCKDVASGSPLVIKKVDKKRDLAVVTGETLPTMMPYIKISCEPFERGQPYFSYGISGYKAFYPLIRQNLLIATGRYAPINDKFDDGSPIGGAMIFKGYGAPGMSGGPVIDIFGYAHGIVTGGSDTHSYHYEFRNSFLCLDKQ